MPGVVATEFGRNALGGGRDSREIPEAETPEDTAEVIADLIEHPRSEVYTRPGFKDRVVAYYSAEDVATVAAGPTTAPATRRS